MARKLTDSETMSLLMRYWLVRVVSKYLISGTKDDPGGPQSILWTLFESE